MFSRKPRVATVIVLTALAALSTAGCAHQESFTGPPPGMPISKALTPDQAAAARNHTVKAHAMTPAQRDRGS